MNLYLCGGDFMEKRFLTPMEIANTIVNVNEKSNLQS